MVTPGTLICCLFPTYNGLIPVTGELILDLFDFFLSATRNSNSTRESIVLGGSESQP